MGQNSAIEWTNHTFNPWIGCTRVSEGCRNCYAERIAERFGVAAWGPRELRTRTADTNWKKPLTWNRKAEREGRRYRVFCASMADVFDDHPGIKPEWRRTLGTLIAATHRLDWLLLTKRPENIEALLAVMFPDGVPPNVRIGVSVEDQATADKRIPELLAAWGGPNFVSYEPAIGGVDFNWWLNIPSNVGSVLNWIIAGSESGPGARPAHPDWFRSVRDQCQAAGVPYFFKQWGEWVTEDQSPEDAVLPGHSVMPWVKFHKHTGKLYGDKTSV